MDTIGVAGGPSMYVLAPVPVVPQSRSILDEYCAQAGDMIGARSRPAAVPHDGGEMALTAVWSLFLKPHYQFDRWTVLVGGAAGAGSGFCQGVRSRVRRRGRHWSDHRLPARATHGPRQPGPWLSWSDATKRLAAGDFQSRLRMKSGDEFQVLGEAFDSMAEQIGTQITELEMLSQVDRNLQTADMIKGQLMAAAQGPRVCWARDGARWCHEHWGQCGRHRLVPRFRGRRRGDTPISPQRHAVDGGLPGGCSVQPGRLRVFCYCGAGSAAAFFVFQKPEFAVADILIRQVQPADARFVSRVGDVLAISLFRY